MTRNGDDLRGALSMLDDMNAESNLTEAAMRAAIARRDPAYDGRFVYAVITTGVYCRPVCAARRARPENLRFFATAENAAAAGFRPCKRCRPDDPLRSSKHMVELARYIEANAEERFSLEQLAARQGLSPSYLQKAFKRVFGISPKAYQDAIRLRRVKGLLRDGDDVTGAIFEAGYGSSSRFYERAARSIGMTPKSYQAGGAGEEIVYACRSTALGPLMIAATQRGVCFVMFGANEAELRDALQREFSNAQLLPSPAGRDSRLDDWIAALEAHLSQDAPLPDVPVDLRGTAFQVRVWQFLLGIPEGDAVSYADVAAGTGRPRAVRAAASACAKNRIAVLVPCHRVLRGDGGIGGYRWGLDKKRALLDVERRRKAARV